MRPLLTFALLCLANASSFGTERPTTGIVYNITEASSITYECNPAGPDLVCKFNQTSVRHIVDPKDQAQTLEKARSEYRSLKNKMSECGGIADIVTALENHFIPPGVTSIKQYRQFAASPEKKRRFLENVQALVEYCRHPSEAAYVEIARRDFQSKVKTCSVSGNQFEQRFKYFPSTNTWVVKQDEPEGICGIVNVSKFEPETSSGLTFWKYVAKKVVTNKSGRIILGSCSQLDEREYTYDWRSEPRDMDCQIIKFGVF